MTEKPRPAGGNGEPRQAKRSWQIELANLTRTPLRSQVRAANAEPVATCALGGVDDAVGGHCHHGADADTTRTTLRALQVGDRGAI